MTYASYPGERFSCALLFPPFPCRLALFLLEIADSVQLCFGLCSWSRYTVQEAFVRCFLRSNVGLSREAGTEGAAKKWPRPVQPDRECFEFFI